MFVAVILKRSRIKLVVPKKWIQALDEVKIFNDGAKKTKYRKIFYCENIESDANFGAPLLKHFSVRKNGARYYGKILQGFCKYMMICRHNLRKEFIVT